jgi:PAS domain S-box-containing protein
MGTKQKANNTAITKHEKNEGKIPQLQVNLTTYLENAPDGVYLNDLKGTFLYGNKKAEQITGYKREELVGSSFLKLNILPVAYLARAAKLLALNLLGRSTGPDEFELIKKDGTHILVEINTTPVKEHGNVTVIGFVREITERKRIETLLNESETKYKALTENLCT